MRTMKTFLFAMSKSPYGFGKSRPLHSFLIHKSYPTSA